MTIVWKAGCFLGALVACYAPTPPQGRVCGEGGACPSGLVCQDAVCVRDVVPDASNDALVIDALDALVFDAPAASCPASYAAVAGQSSRYRVVTTAQTWSDAEADCESHGVGTHLAVVDDMDEHAAVDALTGASIWFGLTDRKVEGTPRWVTGATPTYTNYGIASNNSLDDCAGIFQGTWVWGDCKTLIPYVCECDGIPAQPSAY